MISTGKDTKAAGPLLDQQVGFFVFQAYKENRRKCTVEPLLGSAGLEVQRLGVPVAGEELLAQ